jgi:hypothetical protein
LIRAVLVALALLVSAPASAVEVIINYTTLPGLVGLATSLGYYSNGAVTTAGLIATGGSYYFNNVGQVVQTPASGCTITGCTVPAVMAPGLWARLRHNGDPALLAAQMPSSATLTSYGVTLYQWAPTLNSGVGCWSSDGATCGAAAYVAGVGQIM